MPVVYVCTLGTLFFDVIVFFLAARLLNQWVWTFQRYLWPYFWVWICSCKLIQLFRFASFILYFEPNVSHITRGSISCQSKQIQTPSEYSEIFWHDQFFTIFFFNILQILLNIFICDKPDIFCRNNIPLGTVTKKINFLKIVVNN